MDAGWLAHLGDGAAALWPYLRLLLKGWLIAAGVVNGLLLLWVGYCVITAPKAALPDLQMRPPEHG